MSEPFLTITVGEKGTPRTFDFPDTQRGRKQAHLAIERLTKYLEHNKPDPAAASKFPVH
jgi:hypothetical protein